MRPETDNPFSLFLAVIRSMVGWTISMVATVVVGTWLGMCLGQGKLCGLIAPLNMLAWSVVTWVLFPHLLVAYGVAGLCWYVPIWFDENDRLKVCAAAVSLVVWTVAVMSIVRVAPFW